MITVKTNLKKKLLGGSSDLSHDKTADNGF